MMAAQGLLASQSEKLDVLISETEKIAHEGRSIIDRMFGAIQTTSAPKLTFTSVQDTFYDA